MANENIQMPASQAGGALAGGLEHPAVDQRILEAIIRAVYRHNSLVLRYGWISNELKDIARDEYRRLDEDAYNLIVGREIRNVYMIYYHPNNTDNNIVAVVPCESDDLLEILEELADLYNYTGYEDPTAYKYNLAAKPDRPSLEIVMHNLIKLYCSVTHRTYRLNIAKAVYDTFNVYKLEKSFQEIIEGVKA